MSFANKLKLVVKGFWSPILIGSVASLFWIGVTGFIILRLPVALVILKSMTGAAHEVLPSSIAKQNKQAGNFFDNSDYKNSLARLRLYQKGLNLKVIVKNKHKIPKDGKLVVIANHPTPNDYTFIMGILDQIRPKTSKVLIAAGVPGDLENSGFIKGVDKGRLTDGTAKVVSQTIQNEEALVIFPSASHNPKDKYKAGFLRFAIEEEADILPVYVKIKYPFWMRAMVFINPSLFPQIIHTFMHLLYQNNRITVIIGDPIKSQKILEDDKESFLKYGNKQYPEKVLAKYKNTVDALAKVR